MMEYGDIIGGVLTRKTDAVVKDVGQSSESKVVRYFKTDYTRFLDLETASIPPEPSEESIEREGTVGVLPSAAKRIIVAEALAGFPPSPVKVSEETVVTGEPEKRVDELALHVITEVNPATAADAKEIEIVIQALREASSIVEQSVWRPSSDKPPIRIADRKAVIYIIQRGIMGNYGLKVLNLRDSGDLQKAIDVYRQSLSEVLQFNRETNKPQDDVIAHELYYAQIAKEIAASRGNRKISLPVVVCPKAYSYVAEHAEPGLKDYYYAHIAKKQLHPSDKTQNATCTYGKFETLVGREPFLSITTDGLSLQKYQEDKYYAGDGLAMVFV